MIWYSVREWHMDVFEAICVVDGGIRLCISVLPHAGKSGFEGVDKWRKRLVVKVKSLPQNNEANKEVVELIERITKCRCEIVCGWKNRQKTVLIHGNRDRVLQSLRDVLTKDLNG
ncbi:MAG: DUF167 family protein [archaeon]|nr:DUF167 family protein [archaeon]